jgi:DNA polymerase-1
MVKVAMARIARAVLEAGLDARLVNMVHDELVLEASDADADAAARLVAREMMSAGAEFVKKVPMTVDVAVGDTWCK